MNLPVGRHGAYVAIFLFLLCFSLPSQAEALPFRVTGGMGVTLWPISVEGAAGHRSGLGVGINGRVLVQLGHYLRLQAGLLQGQYSEDDRTVVLRRIIGGSLEAFYEFHRGAYITAGARLGGENLEMVETLGYDGDGRVVSDIDEWRFVAQPLIAGGIRLANKYHIEIENGIVLSRVNGRFSVSYAIVIGVYFRMASNFPPPGQAQGSHDPGT